MTALQIIFYAFAATAVVSSLMVITVENAVHGVLFLVLTFFASAGIWMILNAEFLSIVLVLVYVGAVMTLFLFVVMMLSMRIVSAQEGFVRYLPFIALIILFVTGLVIMALSPTHFGLTSVAAPTPAPADYNNIADLGSVLYTNYAWPFELAAVLLLIGIIAAIALTHRKPEGRKSQVVSQQMAVQRDQRVRLISMPSEKKQ